MEEAKLGDILRWFVVGFGATDLADEGLYLALIIDPDVHFLRDLTVFHGRGDVAAKKISHISASVCPKFLEQPLEYPIVSVLTGKISVPYQLIWFGTLFLTLFQS